MFRHKPGLSLSLNGTRQTEILSANKIKMQKWIYFEKQNCWKCFPISRDGRASRCAEDLPVPVFGAALTATDSALFFPFLSFFHETPIILFIYRFEMKGLQIASAANRKDFIDLRRRRTWEIFDFAFEIRSWFRMTNIQASLYLDGALMCHLINFWSLAIQRSNFHFRVAAAGSDDNDFNVTTRLQFRFSAVSRTSHDNSLSNIFASIMIVAQKKGRNWT